MARFFEKFKRDVVGIVWGACGLFVGLALASHHSSDPSFNTFAKSSGKIQNICGYFGSFLSDIMFYFFGLVAWLFVAVMFWMAVRAFKGQNRKMKLISIVWSSLIFILAGSLVSLYFPKIRIYDNQVALGGAIGMVVSHGLIKIFNPGGVAVILWASLAVMIVFYTEKSVKELAILVTALLRPLWSRIVGFKGGAEDAINLEKPVGGETPSEVKHRFFLKELTKPKPEILMERINKKQKAEKLTRVMQQTPREIENWKLPSIDLLLEQPQDTKKFDEKEISRNATLVEQKLGEFDVTGQVVEVKPGPAVTMYEFRPAASVKINEITKLADDLSLALSAESLRIIAPIPGRDVVGIETSNSARQSIYMKELLESPEFWSPEVKLPVALGKGVTGEAKIIDLRRLPHLLVAGTTGSGKSVFIMSLVTSLIMRHSPKTLKLILVDPKQVDLAAFHKIPHLLMPPVKETRPAINTLKWLVKEMEKRYRSMSQFSAKNIEGYNEVVKSLSEEERLKHEEKNKAFEGNPQTALQSYYTKQLPYIVMVIEEFADLMSVDRVGVEPLVVRLAQMARASGIHLVIAMQSPRREVLTGLIKTNFPGRISFKVAGKVDSTIILDQRGAERLLSVGDMLYLAPAISQPQRYHGAFLRDEEINAVTEFWVNQGEPQFEEGAIRSLEVGGAENIGAEDGTDRGADYNEDYDQVVAYVTSQKEVSASLLQRRFRFGYPKAARMIEMLESEGVVGPSNGSKPRQVIANRLD